MKIQAQSDCVSSFYSSFSTSDVIDGPELPSLDVTEMITDMLIQISS